MPGADLPVKAVASGARRMLMVPTSCSTSQRQDAVEAERMLREILTSPADAAERHAPVNSCATGTTPDTLLVYHRSRLCLCPASA